MKWHEDGILFVVVKQIYLTYPAHGQVHHVPAVVQMLVPVCSFVYESLK